MRKLLVLSTLLIGAAPFAGQAAPAVSAMPASVVGNPSVEVVREASEGPRREDRQRDRRQDRRSASLGESTDLRDGIVLVREGSASGGNRAGHGRDRGGR